VKTWTKVRSFLAVVFSWRKMFINVDYAF